jgi:tetratricopeptide (TPR) repeat protein
MGRADMAYKLVAGDRQGLTDLAFALKDNPTQQGLAARCTDEANDILLKEISRSDAPAQSYADFASKCANQGDDRNAIEFYQRALSREYGQVDWRFSLAQLLAKSGKFDEAAHQARACLELRPQMKAAQDLLESANARLAPGHF